MKIAAGFVPGIALLAIGMTKVWTHTNSLEAFLSVRCGPGGLSQVQHAPSFWTSLFAGHCWGCPVALTGAAMIVAAAMLSLPAARLNRRTSIRVS